MSVFLIITCLGLAGLLVMALPGLVGRGGHHAKGGRLQGHAGGHVGPGHAGAGHALGSGHATGHGGAGHALGHAALAGAKGMKGAHVASHAQGAAASAIASAGSLKGGHPGALKGGRQSGAQPGASSAWLSLIPEPRAVLSIITLFGAFGEVFNALLPFWFAALAALPAAAFLEWAVVGRLYRLALGFQGRPASSLTALVLEEAQAVTPFRNGKGLVRVVRDGRAVQLSAHLAPGQLDIPVRVGDKVRIEDVDSEKERVVVTLL